LGARQSGDPPPAIVGTDAHADVTRAPGAQLLYIREIDALGGEVAGGVDVEAQAVLGEATGTAAG